YDLTNLARESFALWPMASQYLPMAPYNPESLIANHRLFYVAARKGSAFDPVVLTAILNSTLVNLWKNFYGRYTGTEGSLDTEIVDVNLIDVPKPDAENRATNIR